MSQEEFAAAFRRSPMKRAKLRGLERDVAVVLGNIRTMEDVPVLQQALDNPERWCASTQRGRLEGPRITSESDTPAGARPYLLTMPTEPPLPLWSGVGNDRCSFAAE